MKMMIQMYQITFFNELGEGECDVPNMTGVDDGLGLIDKAYG